MALPTQPDFDDLASQFKNNSVTKYDDGYEALLKFGKSIKTKEDGVILAHAVYAWMPTILNKWDFDDIGLGAIQAGILPDKPFLNNSWVGTSKFMHFVAPDVWPIWDSRVAVHFGMKHRYQYEKRDVYSEYADFVLSLVGNVEHCTPWSDVRYIELVLFSAR